MLHWRSVVTSGLRNAGGAPLQSLRAFSVEVSKRSVPTTPFQRPKGITWSDNSGDQHFTAMTKQKAVVYTGDPDSRMPVDPYHMDVTPSQVKKLDANDKKGVSKMKDILRKWNSSAYADIDKAIQMQQEKSRDQEEATAFMNMMRRWNDKAYTNVDQELQKNKRDAESVRAMQKILRGWNPTVYEKVDAELQEHREAAQKFNHKPKGIEWMGTDGKYHFRPMSKPKMDVHTANADDLPPLDPYRV